MKLTTINLNSLVLLAMVGLPAIGFAQTYGSVTGRVTDPSGAVIAGAPVSLTNVNSNTARNAVATDAGVYTFAFVPPGRYTLKADVSGFKQWVSNEFEVQVQQAVRIDAQLQVGKTSETVEVAAAADLLQSETAALGTVIENKIVTELPLNGRQYLNLVALSPNVNVLSPAAGQANSRQGGNRAAQSISTGGQRITFDYFTLDGVNNTDPNFNTYIALPSIDAIQEFKVQMGVYPAEYGHESTQINVLTKSGGNSYHGALFEFLRNDVMDAKQYQFTTVKPKNPFKWNDYGFELDGPVWIPHLFNGQNKLFFMANYEGFRLRQTSLTSYSVPTAKMFTGDFSELLPTTLIYDPQTGMPFPNNVIPRNRLDPTSLKFLNYYHSATLPGLANNFVENTSAPLNRDAFVLRMDYNQSSKSQWMGRYNWGDENQSTQALAGAGQKILTNYKQYEGSNTQTFTPTLVNEARFGYTQFFNTIGTLLADHTNVVGALGVPGLNPGLPVTWGIPNANFTGFTGLGDTNDGPYANNNNNLQFVDKVSWVHGKHALAFGFEYDRQNYNQVGNQFSRGVFNFQALTTKDPATNTGGYGFAEFLLGNIYQSTVAVSIANAQFQRNVEQAFVDDTWKLTPKLTLSLGLRYELTPPFTDTLDNLFTVAMPRVVFTANAPQSDWPTFVRQSGCTDPYQGLNIRWTSTPAVCGGGLNHNLMQTQHNNFAPRFGMAYSPDRKTVIRSGFGIFFLQDIGNAMYFDLSRNIAARVDEFWGNPATPTLTWSNSIPGGNGAVAQIPPPYAYAAAYDHATSYTMQYLLNVQRQLGSDWVVEAGYLGSESHHLYGFQNLNQAVPGTTGSIASRQPFADFGVIQWVTDGLNANYNAGSMKVTRRFSQGLSFTTSYTWSKSMDNSSGIRPQGSDQLFPQDSRCLGCEWALSAFDTRNRFSFGGVYDLPVGRGKLLNVNNAVGNAVVGGWQLSANMTIQSGVPQTLNIGFTNSGTNTPQSDRPTYTGSSLGYAAEHTRSSLGIRWYDAAAFTVAPAGSFGDVGRNSLITPHLQSIDLAVHKEFPMAYNEHHVLQFRLEAFNVFNHPVWGAPTGNLKSAAFGNISTTALPMRQLQVGLKYLF